MLETVDLSVSLSREEYRELVDPLQLRVRQLHMELTERRRPIIVVYEGWDAAGKGGNIKRLTQRLDPRFFSVYGIGKPTQEELDHHYLWRFWTKLPARNQMVVFDRSWYGRVLVERVEGFATEAEWRRAYGEINAFEKMIGDDNTLVLKFWLHVSPEEQLHRFEARLKDPMKRWKMNEEDWRNRGKWSQYAEAVEDMLRETGTAVAPWVVVEGDDKRWARIKVLRTVVQRFEDALGQDGAGTPPAETATTPAAEQDEHAQ